MRERSILVIYGVWTMIKEMTMRCHYLAITRKLLRQRCKRNLTKIKMEDLENYGNNATIKKKEKNIESYDHKQEMIR
jgi:hypothetical protein